MAPTHDLLNYRHVQAVGLNVSMWRSSSSSTHHPAPWATLTCNAASLHAQHLQLLNAALILERLLLQLQLSLLLVKRLSVGTRLQGGKGAEGA